MRTILIWAATALVSITAQQVSTNGRCGNSFGNRVCKGSSYGNCCSQYSWCGSTSGHCGTGCQSNFGTCSIPNVSPTIRSSTLRTSTISSTRSSSIAASSTRTLSTAVASPSSQVSKNGRCGNANGAVGGFTCKGSAYGNCCSQYSYCGSTSAYCGTGCQPGFGTCSDISSSVRSSSTSSSRSSSASSSSPRSSSASSSISSASSSTQVSSSAASSSASTSSSVSSIASSPSSSTPSPSVASTSSASPTVVLSSSLESASPSPTPSITSSAISTPEPSSPTPTPSSSIPDPLASSIISTPEPSSSPPISPLTQIVANPSFELGKGPSPIPSWALERLYVINVQASGRFANDPRTGSYAIRGRGQLGGGYDIVLSQTVRVVPGSSYTIRVFAKQTTAGFCSVSIYLGNQVVREFVPPGTEYTEIEAVVNIGAQDAAEQVLMVDGACSLPGEGVAEAYDLFIDDVTMSLVGV